MAVKRHWGILSIIWFFMEWEEEIENKRKHLIEQHDIKLETIYEIYVYHIRHTFPAAIRLLGYYEDWTTALVSHQLFSSFNVSAMYITVYFYTTNMLFSIFVFTFTAYKLKFLI